MIEGGVRNFLHRCLRPGLMAAMAMWLFGGCSLFHPHKQKSYDKAFDNEDQDPTYHSDPQRAGEEIRYVQ